jgi:hypothetical protein
LESFRFGSFELVKLGLVLYEIATGQRAFAGDTAPVLHHAILNQNPIPVRDLSPGIPSKLEWVINKAIRKDRETRFQSAFEVRTELQTLKADMERRGSSRWGISAAVIMLLLVFGILWFAKRQHRLVSPPADLKLKQLTSNSYEHRITDARISPDGKYLVYTDARGIYLKALQTNETQTMALPESLRRQKNGADAC